MLTHHLTREKTLLRRSPRHLKELSPCEPRGQDRDDMAQGQELGVMGALEGQAFPELPDNLHLQQFHLS